MYHHFAQRLKERYGLEITPLEYIDLVQQKMQLIKGCQNGRQIVKVHFKGTIIIAVKQKSKNRFLVTALPRKTILETKQ